jgi:hypothetical protein
MKVGDPMQEARFSAVGERQRTTDKEGKEGRDERGIYTVWIIFND